MKLNKISLIFAAAVMATPLALMAQNAPQAAVISAAAPGSTAVAEAMQLQGKVKSIDKKTRKVVVLGGSGREVVINAGPEVKNFDQVRVGDMVTLTYVHALALELRKVENKGIPERIESGSTTTAKPGEKPGVTSEYTVRVVADVVAINPKAQTVTLRGAKRTVEVEVKDAAMLKALKVGDQVDGIFTEAVALEVTAAEKRK